MKKSRIVSGVLAGVMAASVMTVGFSASAATLKKPAGVKAVNVSKGITVSWGKVTGAKTYKVYRNKKFIKTVKTVKYTDTSVTKGTIYKYKIVALNGNKKSKASDEVSIKRLVAPKITKCSAMITGKQRINVYWSKSLGTDKYVLYRKTTGKYAKLATIKGKRSYADKSVKAGVKYTYKVKAFYKNTSSSVASAAKYDTYLAQPKVALSLKDGQFTLTWDKVAGATSYTVLDEAGAKIAKVKTTTYTGDVTASNYDILGYAVRANCATSSSADAVDYGVYVPKGSYYTDSQGNLHAAITLKAGETFGDGAIVASILSADSNCQFGISGGDAAVATVENFIIKAVAAGTTTFDVSYNQASAAVVNATLGAFGYDFHNKLTTGVAFVEVTVE